MSARLLVSHPHAAAFANGTAAGLERQGLLGLYVVGVAAAKESGLGRTLERMGTRHPVLLNRVVHGVPPTRLRSLSLIEGGSRVVGRLGRAVLAKAPSLYDAMFVAHDAAVALMPWPAGISGVYAYEDGALRTFRRAAKIGLERIWDLPIPHYATLERMWAQEVRRWPGAMNLGAGPYLPWTKRRKDAELALATRVSVPSIYTRESLESAGVKVPVGVTPFGFPVDEFAPKRTLPDQPFTVITVGTHNLRKGTPYLLEAWKKAAIPQARLRLVGAMQLRTEFLAQYAGIFEHVPSLPRARLGDIYRSADLMVLPTLGDGCPLVVQESMSCGTPVLTTRCGNGPDFVTTGVDGWVVPERNVDALVERLREAARDRDKVLRVGKAARARAERWTWLHASQALAKFLA